MVKGETQSTPFGTGPRAGVRGPGLYYGFYILVSLLSLLIRLLR